MKFTNTKKGPRGLNTKTGTVLVEPGQAVDVEVYERELPVIKNTGWFVIGQSETKVEKAAAEKKVAK
jgi:hypothetical protein